MKKKFLISIIGIILALVMTAGLGSSFVSHAAAQYPIRLDVVVASDDGFCNLRVGPGTDYAIIQPIYNGTGFTVQSVTQSSYDGLVWGYISYNGRTGWISMLTTNVSSVWSSSRAQYDVRVTVPENIYLRGGPGAEFTSFYRPYAGQVLRIEETVINPFDGRPWGKTYINGIRGWVSLDWTSRDNGTVYNRTSDLVWSCSYQAVIQLGDTATYFNNGPGLSYQTIFWIPNGTPVYVTTIMDNSQDGMVWGETTYNGRTGWVPMNYTRLISAADASDAAYTVTVSNSSNIRLRSGPGTEYMELVSYIPNNTSLYITQTVVNRFDGRPWGKTYYNGQEGWVSLNWTYR